MLAMTLDLCDMNKTDLWGVFLRDVCKKERDHEIERERKIGCTNIHKEVHACAASFPGSPGM